MNFRSILFVFCILFFSVNNIFAQGHWIKMNSPVLPGKTLKKSFFTDSTNGWAAGDSGIVIHTNDGLNFFHQHTGIHLLIEDIHFINKNIGWALANNYIGLGAILLRTTNSGLNWTIQPLPDSSLVLYNVFFLNQYTGFISGYNGTFLKTTNSGDSWTRKQIDSNFISELPVYELIIKNNNYYACGGFFDLSGVVWNSTNSGETWSGVSVGGEPVYDLVIYDDMNIIGIGGDLEFGCTSVKTTNGGIDWEYTLLNIFGIGEAIAHRTGTELWASLGFSQKLIYSTDLGVSWTESVQIFDSSFVYDIIFTDAEHGYAFGTNGLILKYVNSPIGINNITEHTSGFTLSQNFPNPFNPVTKIKFIIPHTAYVSLVVYNSAGQMLKKLINEQLRTGEYTIDFNGSEVPSGIYFYELNVDNRSETKKMILLK